MSTCPSRVSAARARADTVAGSVTSPGTAQAWRPAARSSVANASIPVRVRASTTTAYPARVAGAAPELLGESQGPGPLGDVGKHDPGAVLALVLGHGGLEGGDVRRV